MLVTPIRQGLHVLRKMVSYTNNKDFSIYKGNENNLYNLEVLMLFAGKSSRNKLINSKNKVIDARKHYTKDKIEFYEKELKIPFFDFLNQYKPLRNFFGGAEQ